MSDDDVLEILRVIQGNIAGLSAGLDAVRTELRIHTETFDVLLQEGRSLRGTVSDSARGIISRTIARGEMEAIHHDLNRLRHDISALMVRVAMIEEHISGNTSNPA
jgi:hypothetical protein